MKELELKYGCNPNQKPAKVFMRDGSELPFTVLNGKPGFINLLDAFNSMGLPTSTTVPPGSWPRTKGGSTTKSPMAPVS